MSKITPDDHTVSVWHDDWWLNRVELVPCQLTLRQEDRVTDVHHMLTFTGWDRGWEDDVEKLLWRNRW